MSSQASELERKGNAAAKQRRTGRRTRKYEPTPGRGFWREDGQLGWRFCRGVAAMVTTKLESTSQIKLGRLGPWPILNVMEVAVVEPNLR